VYCDPGHIDASAGGGPMNPRAIARSQALHIEIRDLLQSHPPLLPPLSAKAIRQRLLFRPAPSVRCLQWHIARIRLEAELALLSSLDDDDCGPRNSPNDPGHG
jgi:hypothetical protein